ncbi:MAG TPA: polymer-forming cytoskeletal protein, partial [Myxococcota bacterium]|nr:polymer-forming cytoskeletal protein [Myxococcota bacterium]
MSGTPSRPPLPTPSRAPREPVLGALPAGGLAGESLEARRTLVVGRGIVLQGSVQDAECVVVEGTVESRIIYAQELSVLQGGVLKGEVEVEDAELAGVMDGTLTSRRSLVVRAGGR